MNIHYCGDAITAMGTLLANIYIYVKSINYTPLSKQKIFSILWCFLWALLRASRPDWVQPLTIHTITCVASIAFVCLLYKQKLKTAMSAYLMSYGISHSLAVIATFFIAIAFAAFLGAQPDSGDPVNLLVAILIVSLQLLLAYLLFKIRRFKNGFPFLFDNYAVIIALISAGVVLTFVSLVVDNNVDDFTFLSLIVGIIITGAGIYIWIRRSMKAFKKKWALNQNEELHQQEMDAKDREIQQYKNMHETVRAANHSMRHRQAAVERRVVGILERARELGTSAEFSGELTVALDEIRKLSKEYQDKINKVKVETALPSTNIQSIDDLFGLFLEQFAINGIHFKLKINGSIVHMIEKVVAQERLETMIGDHLNNALIAVVAATDNTARSILAVIGESGDDYEFSVHDSGIPFEADTLVQLGVGNATTHADEGGSGIGFMTTFETMRECGASLIIKEYAPGGSFSKSVAIRFDGRNQYIIDTNRPGVFPKSVEYIVI